MSRNVSYFRLLAPFLLTLFQVLAGFLPASGKRLAIASFTTSCPALPFAVDTKAHRDAYSCKRQPEGVRDRLSANIRPSSRASVQEGFWDRAVQGRQQGAQQLRAHMALLRSCH